MAIPPAKFGKFRNRIIVTAPNTQYNRTPIIFAASNREAKAIKMLLDHNALLDAQDKVGANVQCDPIKYLSVWLYIVQVLLLHLVTNNESTFTFIFT